jgi:hypothetical protein
MAHELSNDIFLEKAEYLPILAEEETARRYLPDYGTS